MAGSLRAMQNSVGGSLIAAFRRIALLIARYRDARKSLRGSISRQSRHGLAEIILTPPIASISLGLVGGRGMSVRTGRNYRFEAVGNALTAAAMGLAGHYLTTSAIFLGAAALCVPALIALSRIRSDEI